MPYKHGVTGSSPVVPTRWRSHFVVAPPLYGPVVQLVRTPACHAGGRRFESVLGRQIPIICGYSKGSPLLASVAQLVEQRTENPRVVGSIPTGGTKYNELFTTLCGRSSSGRAPPCQGGGSEFEPRRPLHLAGSRNSLNIHGFRSFCSVL